MSASGTVAEFYMAFADKPDGRHYWIVDQRSGAACSMTTQDYDEAMMWLASVRVTRVRNRIKDKQK